ncbi:MAG: hypothetical protein EOM59_19000, partial [Clostridia bacterium]|nr:hypothetical protein [Clostridia bacterium]
MYFTLIFPIPGIAKCKTPTITKHFMPQPETPPHHCRPHLEVSCAIIERDGLVLAARRSATMSLPLKWEFPGG